MRFGGDFSYFFRVTTQDVEMSRFEINFNGQYKFWPNAPIYPYALGGFSIIDRNVTNHDNPGSQPNANSLVGLNVGGGVEVPLSFGFLFTEYKKVFSKAGQWVVSGRLKIGFN